jgi:adenylate cyclase
VVKSLQLTGNIPELSANNMCSNHLAYEFYLRGQGYFSRMTAMNIRFARQMFQKAIDIDPECGRAWAQLACTFACEFLYFHASKNYPDNARQCSIKALEFAPGLPQSHIARGFAHALFGEYAAADQEFQRAIEINPYLFDAWYLNARCKVHEGDSEKAVKLFEKAASVRPDDFQSLILMAAQLRKLGDEEASLKALRQGLARARVFLEFNPDDDRAWGLGAFALLKLGQDDEADTWMNNCLRFAPRCSASTYNAACFYACKGELEKSLDFLEKSIGAGIVNKQWITQDIDLDPVRKLRRFDDIMAKFPKEQTGEENGKMLVTRV